MVRINPQARPQGHLWWYQVTEVFYHLMKGQSQAAVKKRVNKKHQSLRNLHNLETLLVHKLKQLIHLPAHEVTYMDTQTMEGRD